MTLTYKKLLYSVRECAAALGISPNMVRRMEGRGELPCVRIGDRVLFSATELQRFIKNHST